MKTMYACEKCGMVHESWENANKCEESHLSNFDVVTSLCELEYGQGSTTPKKLIVASRTYNYELGGYEYKYFSISKLNEILSDSTDGKQLRFLQDWEDANRENDSINYRKAREAKKALEEADQ